MERLGEIGVVIKEPQPEKGRIAMSSLTPVLRTFARVWRIKLIANVPDKRPSPHNATREVAVHFFYSAKGPYTQEGEITSIFGYQTESPLRLWRPHPQSIVPVINRLYDFSGVEIAYVERNSIFIGFDFLSSSWDGHKEVLAIILHFGLARILAPGKPDINFGQRLAARLRRELAGSWDNGEERFLQIVRDSAARAISLCEAGLQDTLKKTRELEQEWIGILRDIAKLREYLKELSRRIATEEEYGEDFERIMRLKGVVRLEIRGDSIYVFTHRINQIFPPFSMPDAQQTYCVGSFEIRVYSLGTDETAVSFRQAARGHHISYQYKVQLDKVKLGNASLISGFLSICFGNRSQPGFLNQKIAKMVADFNVPALIGLILSFLRHDNEKPETVWPVPDEEELSREPEGYKDDEARAAAKAAYIRIVCNAHEHRLNKTTTEKLGGLIAKDEERFSSFAEQRRLAEETRALVKDLKVNRDKATAQAKNAWGCLKLHPKVLGVEVRGELRIWVYDPEQFPYPILIWLDADAMPRIFTPYYFPGGRPSHDVAFSNAEAREVATAIATGKVVDTLTTVIDFLTKPTPVNDYYG